MKRWIANWIRRVNLIFLLGVWAAASVQNVQAAEQEPRVLRVPFPQVTGMTETTPDGRRQGLVVDYLNEIAKYTGWEYEYIDTDSDNMVEEFLEGKYDLMGGNYYSPGFEEFLPIRIITSGTVNQCSWPGKTTAVSTAMICAA